MNLSQLVPKFNKVVTEAGQLLTKLSQDPKMRQPQMKKDGKQKVKWMSSKSNSWTFCLKRLKKKKISL